jgi:hypothetical protein
MPQPISSTSSPPLLAVTVARKPLSEGSVARNVLKHGTGGLNIDGCRLGDTTRTNKSSAGGGNRNVLDRPYWTGVETQEHDHGRWPANLLFLGTAAPEGTADFFMQAEHRDALTEYLRVLVSSPAGSAIVLEDLDAAGKWAEDSCVGLIARGTPTTDQAEMLKKALKPGGHLLLIAPDQQPTGHTGACRVEDAGFEIRDSLLLVQGPGKLHYVPKPARSEREAGCTHLSPKTGAQAVERKEGTDGLKSPRAGAGRTASTVRNFHPTVKAIGIMEALLGDVAKGAVVGDPFMGSGTTGIACLKTGHSFVGIERDEEYLPIADARVRHWNGRWWRGAVIASDAPEYEEPEREEADLLDFLMGGGE